MAPRTTLLARLNALMDLLPTHALVVGRGSHSPYTLFAISGFFLAMCAFVALAAIRGDSLLASVSVGPVGMAAYLAYGRVRKGLTGAETYVALEAIVACGVAILGFGWLGFGDPAQWVDPLAVAIAVAMASGRLGCATYGCCYGVRSDLGILYPPSAPGGFARRFPVQLVESVTWMLLALVGAAFTVFADKGAAFAVLAVVYGGVRFTLEGLRDDPRPTWAGLSESRWLSIGMVAIGIAADAARRHLDLRMAGVSLIGLLLGFGLFSTRNLWFSGGEVFPRSVEGLLEDFGARLRATTPDRVEHTCRAGHLLAGATFVRVAGEQRLVLDLRAEELAPEEVRIAFDTILRGLGAAGAPVVQLHENRATLEIGVEGSPAAARSSYFGEVS